MRDILVLAFAIAIGYVLGKLIMFAIFASM